MANKKRTSFWEIRYTEEDLDGALENACIELTPEEKQEMMRLLDSKPREEVIRVANEILFYAVIILEDSVKKGSVRS